MTYGDGLGVAAQVGTVWGEDYHFQFSGKIREGKLHFRLNMQYEGEEPEQPEEVRAALVYILSLVEYS